MAKKKQMTLEEFLMFLALSCIIGLNVVSLVCSQNAKTQFNAMNNNDSMYNTNWNRDLVFGITNDPGYTLPSAQFYLSPIALQWPGTALGCDCTQSTTTKIRTKNPLKKRDCNSTEIGSKCVKIESSAAVKLDKWRSSTFLYTVRAKKTSFLDTYLGIDSTGKCLSSSNVNVGDKSSISRGFCLPSLLTLPITDISNTSKSNYNSVNLGGGTTAYLGSPSMNPFCEVVFSKDQAFVGKTGEVFGLFGTYGVYQTSTYADEVKKVSGTSIDSLSVKDFNTLNTFSTDKYPALGTDGNINLLAVRPYPWSPSCADLVPLMTSRGDKYNDTADTLKLQAILLIVGFSLAVASLVLGVVILTMKAMWPLGAYIPLRLVIFLIALPTTVATLSKMQQLYDFDDGALACTEGDFARDLDARKTQLKKPLTNMKVCLAFWIIAAIIEIGVAGFLFALKFKECWRERRFRNEMEQDNARVRADFQVNADPEHQNLSGIKEKKTPEALVLTPTVVEDNKSSVLVKEEKTPEGIMLIPVIVEENKSNAREEETPLAKTATALEPQQYKTMGTEGYISDFELRHGLKKGPASKANEDKKEEKPE